MKRKAGFIAILVTVLVGPAWSLDTGVSLSSVTYKSGDREIAAGVARFQAARFDRVTIDSESGVAIAISLTDGIAFAHASIGNERSVLAEGSIEANQLGDLQVICPVRSVECYQFAADALRLLFEHVNADAS